VEQILIIAKYQHIGYYMLNRTAGR